MIFNIFVPVGHVCEIRRQTGFFIYVYLRIVLNIKSLYSI